MGAALHPGDALAAMQAKAGTKGGALLSTDYLGAHVKYLWRCSNGSHLPWGASYSNVVNGGRWCPQCKADKLATLHRFTDDTLLTSLRDAARRNGGRLISTVACGTKSNVKYQFQCAVSAHGRFSANYSNVVNGGTWCRKCGTQRAADACRIPASRVIKILRRAARVNGGRLITAVSKGTNAKYEFKCGENGHGTFRSWYRTVVDGGWCSKCRDVRTSERCRLPAGILLGNLQKKARSHGGRLLSVTAHTTSSKYLFQCSDAMHPPFWMRYNCVVGRSKWCPKCGNEKMRVRMRRDYSKHRFGSASFPVVPIRWGRTRNGSTEWECLCFCGNKFIARIDHVKSGGIRSCGCRSVALCETEIFQAFKEHVTDAVRNQYVVIRPGQRPLQLDGYSPQLQVAFEYQGEQHYRPVRHFGGVPGLKRRSRRDRYKRRWCMRRGIALIEIRYDDYARDPVGELVKLKAAIEARREQVAVFEEVAKAARAA